MIPHVASISISACLEPSPKRRVLHAQSARHRRCVTPHAFAVNEVPREKGPSFNDSAGEGEEPGEVDFAKTL